MGLSSSRAADERHNDDGIEDATSSCGRAGPAFVETVYQTDELVLPPQHRHHIAAVHPPPAAAASSSAVLNSSTTSSVHHPPSEVSVPQHQLTDTPPSPHPPLQPAAAAAYNDAAQRSSLQRRSCSSTPAGGESGTSLHAPSATKGGWSPLMDPQSTASTVTAATGSSSIATTTVTAAMASSSPSAASISSSAAASLAPKCVGLENYGNTCYCNAVLQLMYHCRGLRLRLLDLMQRKKDVFVDSEAEETLLFKLAELFDTIQRTKIAKSKKGGNSAKHKQPQAPIVGPNAFLQRVRKENVAFRNAQQQDAHEFCMFVLNTLIDNEKKLVAAGVLAASALHHSPYTVAEHTVHVNHSSSSKESVGDGPLPCSSPDLVAMITSPLLHTSGPASLSSVPPPPTSAFAAALMDPSRSTSKVQQTQLPSPPPSSSIQRLFEGVFSAETSCMECETTTSRQETFLDLSIELSQNNISLARCFENFSAPEFLMGSDKFRCDACCGSTPGRRCMRLHRTPEAYLIVHLKRFKYVEAQQSFRKLSWRVNLPHEIAVHTTSSAPSPSSSALSPQRPPEIFVLKGFVLHQGSGPHLGHYIACIRCEKDPNVWRRYDDDIVTEMTERDVQTCFGIPFSSESASTSTAYIILYEREM